jgi:hypothetical protein
LAKNAISSVLNHPGDDIHVLVSDNSTAPEERKELAAFCAGLSTKRLRYINPPEPLPMPHHWEFAIETAQTQYDASHFVILTDRMVFRAGMLRAVLARVAEQPEVVLSYNDDMIHDKTSPVRLERKKLTGQLLDLDPGQLLYLSSIGVFPQSLPRMLNCIVPRKVSEQIRARFGNIYTSVAPDLCHAYRCLANVGVIRYYDAPVMVQYGLAKSNGTGYYGKTTNDAWTDFNRNAGTSGLTYASPIPDLCCNLNIVYHEYCFVREQAQDNALFPAVDWQRYVHAIAHDIHLCANPVVQEQLFNQLRERAGADLLGWTPPASSPPQQLGMDPPEDGTFGDTTAALAYSNRTAPEYVPIADHVLYMQRGWRLAG